MKTILLATALLMSGTAYAQTDPGQAGQPMGSGATMQPGTTMGERDTMGTNMPSGQTGTTTGTTMSDPTMGTTTGTTGTMDSSGTMGTTGSGTMMTTQGGNMAAPPEPRASYPRCSRTITDSCVQSSARESDTKGGRPARRRR